MCHPWGDSLGRCTFSEGRLHPIAPKAVANATVNYSDIARAANGFDFKIGTTVAAEPPLFENGRIIVTITEATPLFLTIPHTCRNSIGIRFCFQS